MLFLSWVWQSLSYVCVCVQVKLGDYVLIDEPKLDEKGFLHDDQYVARIVELYVDVNGARRCAVHWMYRLQVGCCGNVCVLRVSVVDSAGGVEQLL